VTRVINLLGADIARDLIPATSDNVRGYWESAAVIGIHDHLLNSIGPRQTDPFDPLSLPATWQDTKQAQRVKYRLMDQVETEFGGSSLFVVKDPRISRLLPLWLDVLQALKIVIPFRYPLEVAASLAQRDAVSLAKAPAISVSVYRSLSESAGARNPEFMRLRGSTIFVNQGVGRSIGSYCRFASIGVPLVVLTGVKGLPVPKKGDNFAGKEVLATFLSSWIHQ
jgi:hypothetical protein